MNAESSVGSLHSDSVRDRSLTTSEDGRNGQGDSNTASAMAASQAATRDVEEQATSGGTVRFDPPLYIQRYGFVREILQGHKITSVVDFGCAECKFVRWLKGVNTVERIWLVDVDGSLLKSSTELIRPLTYEYLSRRQRPLTIMMLQGSAADLDLRLLGCEAVTLVEVIEHLEDDVLSAVTQNVFGRLRPSLVVMTTPNADYNVLFPGFSGFRHWDHKFEWTRHEFQKWCEAICQQHGYTVSYSGVGDPPTDMAHVGHCSQVAIFTEVAGKPGLQQADLVYTLVAEAVYPVDNRTHTQMLECDVDYHVRQLAMLDDHQMSEDTHQAVIPLDHVVSRLLSPNKHGFQEHEIRKYLQQTYKLSDDGDSVLISLPRYSSSDPSCASDPDDAREAMTIDDKDRLDEGAVSDSEEWT